MRYAPSHFAGTRSMWPIACGCFPRRTTRPSSHRRRSSWCLFLPGDQFLSAALDQQPDLLDRAMSNNIILTTPSTLLALLKAVHSGWQNMRLAENAERIRSLAEDLYARLATFRNHMGKIGGSLESSLRAFNAAVGSLERSVLPGARKFVELGVRGDKPIEELAEIEVSVRIVEGTTPQLTSPEEH